MNAYDTEVRRWLIEQAKRDGITVVTDAIVDRPIYSSRQDRTVWVKDGLSLDAMHWGLCKAERHILFGEIPADAVPVHVDQSPEKRRPLRLISGGVR